MFGHNDNQQVSGQPAQDNTSSNDPAMANDQIMRDGSLENNETNVNGSSFGLNDIPSAPQPVEPPANPFTEPTPSFSTPSLPEPPQASAPAPSTSSHTTTEEDSADLLDLKQKALQQLSPLVNHLDQNPEEKFKTTMMMIQASDDQSLLSAAYEAAQAIPDEKAKAQALLDVVNEINYFTQAH